MEEWRRLTALYSEMGDLEIQELANQINDLTPNAQQILRDELKKRDITGRQSSTPSFRSLSSTSPRDRRTISHFVPASAEVASSEQEEVDDDDGPREYTWKTVLCECQDLAEARAVATMLMEAGIECWIERPQQYYVEPGTSCVKVAADQLEEAKAAISQPIPQELIDEQRELESSPAYELPVCPKCKTPDPILESVEPSNNWLCESCGYTWSDPVSDEAEQRTTPGS
jgi:hypothetical protein